MPIFWVYENWRAHGHRHTIHLADCGFCNHGQGVAGGTRPDNGRWHGSFPALAAASELAVRLGGEVRQCRLCRPGS